MIVILVNVRLVLYALKMWAHTMDSLLIMMSVKTKTPRDARCPLEMFTIAETAARVV